MTAHTDDDVTAVVEVLRAWGHAVGQDAAKTVLDAVAPAIAKRECHRIADGLQRSINTAPRPTPDSGAYEYWRGYRAAAIEARAALRERAEQVGR